MDASNPFSALTLIAAPAVLTNASSVLALGTSNRLSRAVDRARELSTQLEQEEDCGSSVARTQARELNIVQQRLPLLIRALQAFYLAVGAFAAAALVSLIGAVITPSLNGVAGKTVEIIAVVIGAIAVTALSRGALLLVAETRLVVIAIEIRMAQVQKNITVQADEPGR